MLNTIKSYMMPIAMLIGIIFYKQLSLLGDITPYLLIIMLFISYCKLSLKDMRITKLHFLLVLIQLGGSLVVYWLLAPIHPVLAQGAMICVLAPTATAAIVITGMLGGNMVSLAAFSLLSNLSVAIVSPVIFAYLGHASELSFWQSAINICEKVFLILLAPFIASLILKKISPFAYCVIRRKQSVSFYLWSIALTIVTAKTVSFILNQDENNYFIEIAIALIALIICILQFFVGRRLGKRFNDTVAGGQGLGQKNTILAIWMAQTFLNPISSIAPGSYVLWQNLINSYQIWKKRRDIN
ncbi:transporter [Dysgonomonas sp. 216]|uniref:transporter n=1 Tax=Dysgonomonas sp. 216 TaxID=2302934 RepID=UPI0013D814AD|nr:transporter [Dysgonomonas sp. 216]NDW18980.1 transporter [Dysgonomonas sp. 216]